MLTGVIDGTQLCCEDDNSTVGRVPIEDNIAHNQAISLMWTSYGIVVPIILTIGAFGNAAIFIVLSGPVFRGIAYLYLSGLALAHIGVVLSWITISLYSDLDSVHSYIPSDHPRVNSNLTKRVTLGSSVPVPTLASRGTIRS